MFSEFTKMHLPNMFYSWENTIYAEFMLAFLNLLEPRNYHPEEMIATQGDGVIEKIFVMNGEINVGFSGILRSTLKRSVKYTHSIKPGLTVCSEMMFDLKSYFHYRAPTMEL